MSEPRQKPGRSRQDYGTPADFLAAVESRWGALDIDLAATRENAKARSFISPEQDSLCTPWTTEGDRNRVMWLNPPYGNIGAWAEKCAKENARLTAMGRILFLVPASIGSNWFARYVWPYARVWALNGRITFEGCTAPFPKDCILAEYGGLPKTFEVWPWRG